MTHCSWISLDYKNSSIPFPQNLLLHRMSSSRILGYADAKGECHNTNNTLQENQLYLIAARLDGALVIQPVSSDGAPLPGTRRVVPLGGGPIHLTTVPATESSGIRVVAAGKRAVALSVLKKRLSVSALPISVW